jgi:hypothetical protein
LSETFSIGNVLTLVIALVAVAVTWGGVLWRVGRIEKDLEALLVKTDEKMRDFQLARERQGERIGEMEWEVARLSERAGMTTAPGKRRRSTTKASPESEG